MDPLEASVVDKLDRRLLPIFSCMLFSYILSRQSILHAKVTDPVSQAGLQAAVGQDDYTYLWSQGAFAIASLLCFIPSSTLLFHNAEPRSVFVIMLLGFGLIAVFTAPVFSFGGLLTLQVVWGLFQAGYLPCLLSHVTRFYTQDELSLRYAALFSLATSVCALMHLLKYAFVVATVFFGAREQVLPWQLCVAFNGLVALVTAGFVWVKLPNSPETAAFLSVADRQCMLLRAATEAEDRPNTLESTTKPFPQAPYTASWLEMASLLQRPDLWLLSAAYTGLWLPFDALLFQAPTVASVSFFAEYDASPATMDLSHGRTMYATLLFLAPVLVGVILSLGIAYYSDRKGVRGRFAAAALAVASGGFFTLLMCPVSLGAVRYIFGLFPSISGLLCAFPLLLAFVVKASSSLTPTSQTTFLAFTVIFGHAFGLLFTESPTIFPKNDTGSYVGFGICSFLCFFSAMCVIATSWWFRPEKPHSHEVALRRLMNNEEENKAWAAFTEEPDAFTS